MDKRPYGRRINIVCLYRRVLKGIVGRSIERKNYLCFNIISDRREVLRCPCIKRIRANVWLIRKCALYLWACIPNHNDGLRIWWGFIFIPWVKSSSDDHARWDECSDELINVHAQKCLVPRVRSTKPNNAAQPVVQLSQRIGGILHKKFSGNCA